MKILFMANISITHYNTMADKEAIWNKYIGKSVSESLCYVGCGTTIYQTTFINHDGKPICKMCSNNLKFVNIDEFKQHYKLITPDCYLNVNEEITSQDLFKSVLKENKVSVFSSKYGCKYAINLLLTLASEEPEMKICYIGNESLIHCPLTYDNLPHRKFFEYCQVYWHYYNKVPTKIGAHNSIPSLTREHEQYKESYSRLHDQRYLDASRHSTYNILFYDVSTIPYVSTVNLGVGYDISTIPCVNTVNIDKIIKDKQDYEISVGHPVSIIITYNNDYDTNFKTSFLSASTNFISVGIENKALIAIIDKLNGKQCDKQLKYNYIKLFGGQKLVGLEIN
jgi:hypothetical protein